MDNSVIKIKQEYKQLEAQLAEIDKKLKSPAAENTAGLADKIEAMVKDYLRQISGVLVKLVKLSQNSLIIKDGRIVFNGTIAPFSFTYKNVEEVVQDQIQRINFCLKYMATSGIEGRYVAELGKSLNTLYAIYDSVDDYRELEADMNAATRKKEMQTLQAKRAEITAKLDALKVRMDKASQAAAAITNMTTKEYLSREGDGSLKHSHCIPLGFYGDDAIGGDGIPFVLQAEPRKGVVFCETSGSYIRSDKFYEQMLDLVYRSALEFEPGAYQVAMIEGKNVYGSALQSVYGQIENVSQSFLYSKMAVEPNSAKAVLDKLCGEMNARLMTFRSGRITTIEEYNKNHSENRKQYILVLVNGYPELFENKDMRTSLERLMEDGARFGIMTIVFGKNIKLGNYNDIPELDLGRLGVQFISTDDIGNAIYNGNNFVFGGTYHYTESEYADLLSARLKAAKKFYLDSIFEEKATLPFYERIEIPLGKADSGETYYHRTGTEKPPYAFTLVVGKTGSGKSAVIHSLIMSGAMKYAPDELEFHILDFKTSGRSTEFENYKYIKGEENLYIPHVKYLSLQGKPENALDVINYINKLMADRSQLGRFRNYNEINSPKGKKMPQIYVIIDEYHNMLSGGSDTSNDIEMISIKQTLQEGIVKIIQTARVFGIGLIFCGPSPVLPTNAMGQISNRLAFKLDNESQLDAMIENGDKYNNKYPADYTGYALCAPAKDIPPKFVRMAYGGDADIQRNNEDSKRLLSYAKRIRDKYRDKYGAMYGDQVIIGGMGAAPIEKPDAYFTWDEEFKRNCSLARGKAESEQDYINSAVEYSFKKLRPLAIGISGASAVTVSLDFTTNLEEHNYFAYASEASMCRVERNAAFAFLYQTADTKYTRPRIIFCDGSRSGVFDNCFGEYVKQLPFLSDCIEYVKGSKAIAKKLVMIDRDRGNIKQPIFIIMHEIDWLNSRRKVDWLPEAKKPVVDTKAEQKDNDEFQSKLEALKKQGTDIPSFMLNINAARINSAAVADEKKEPEITYTAENVRSAFKSLYLYGNQDEIFMIASSEIYENITDVLLGSCNEDVRKKLLKHAVYGSYDMMRTHNQSTNANICYVCPQYTTTRLYDYTPALAKDWWDDLVARINKVK